MPVQLSRRVVLLVVVGVVAFGFWPSLFGGGSLVSADIVATAPPFDAHRPADFSLENGPGDTIAIHSHWASIAQDVCRGDIGFWNPDLAGGQPTLKGGLPVFALPYLAVAGWYAPGLVAALRTLVAILLSLGYLRSIQVSRSAAMVGAIAYGFSGFMVGWMNWPQSSVAAFAPGLLWAIEGILRDPRIWRAAPLGILGALMAWSNFPAVLIYVLLGGATYFLVRALSFVGRGVLSRSWLSRVGATGVVACVLTALLAGPFLLGFREYLDWSDTSHRVGTPDDSSAGAEYLLSSVAPAVWGSDAAGVPWFGEGNWVEFNAYSGSSVVALALLGIVGGVRSRDRRRRSIALGLGSIATLGVLVAYVGGPLGVALGELTGPLGGLMTRAKVLWSLGIAFAAALGVDHLVRTESVRTLRRDVIAAAGVALLGVAVMTPSISNWFEVVRANGVVRETVAVSTVPLLAGTAVIVVVVALLQGRCSATMAGPILVGVVSVELLAFMMPVPTTVTRSERLTATPAHSVAADSLDPGERLGGEGRTFFAATAQIFDLPDVRGQLLKSPGYQALLREVDPAMLHLSGGGTPTNPNVAIDTDPRSPVWRAMGLGVWTQYPDSLPIGTFVDPGRGVRTADPSVAPVVGQTVVPEGGLRAVVIATSPRQSGFLDVEITTEAGTVEERRWVTPESGGLVSVAVMGEHLDEGSPVTITLRTPESTLEVEVDAQGLVPVGFVAGDDDLELIRVGDVIMFDVPAVVASFVDSAMVEPDPATAAALVAAGSPVVDSAVGLPVAGSPTVALGDVSYGVDEVTVWLSAPSDGLVVVPVANYPGWTAEVDGVPTSIVTANAAFIGVPVPAGTQEVSLRFRPARLSRGIGSILAGVALAAALIAVPLRRRQTALLSWMRGRPRPAVRRSSTPPVLSQAAGGKSPSRPS